VFDHLPIDHHITRARRGHSLAAVARPPLVAAAGAHLAILVAVERHDLAPRHAVDGAHDTASASTRARAARAAARAAALDAAQEEFDALVYECFSGFLPAHPEAV
jgi:hypothetical protein